MSDDPLSWAELEGGPCDGSPVYVRPTHWAVVASRDSDRSDWTMLIVDVTDEKPVFPGVEAHLYVRPSPGTFLYAPHTLVRVNRDDRWVWVLMTDEEEGDQT